MLKTTESTNLDKSYGQFTLLPVVFLGLAMGLSIVVGMCFQHEVNTKTKQNFSHLVDEYEADVFHKLRSYKNTLHVLTNLHRTIEENTAYNSAWQSISAEIVTKDHSPPIHNIGIIDHVEHKALERYIEERKTKAPDEGYEVSYSPNFYPNQTQKAHFIIRHSSANAINEFEAGFDMYSIIQARKALLNAQTTKDLTLSEPITLHQNYKKKSGFLLINPIVNKDKTITSFVFITFFADEFFETSKPDISNHLYFQVKHNDNPFYQSTTNLLWNAQSPKSLEDETKILGINNTLEWNILWRTSHTFTTQHSKTFYYILLGGFALSLLIYLLLAHIFKKIIKRTQTLIEQKERYELAMEGAQNGIWDWDITTDEIYYSPRFRQLLEYDGNDTRSFPNTLESFENHLHPEDRNKTLRAILDHVQYNIPFTIEYRLRTRTGSYRYFFAKGKAFQDKNGRAVRMTGSTTDVTLQRNTQHELIKEKNYSDHIVNHNPALIIALSSLGITRQINPKVLRITGYTSEEVIGQNWWDLCLPHKSEKEVLEVMNRFSIDEPVIEYEIPLVTKFGEERLISWTSLNQYDDYNELEEIIIFGIDVTERHKFEGELIAAKNTAEQASRAKSDFLAGMSHEIRTPMNGVIGTATLLSETKLTKTQQKYLDIIVSSGRTLIEIINEILDYSKIEAGSLTIYEKTFDLHKCLDEQFALLEPLAKEKNLKYLMEYDKGLPQFIKSDEVRIRQILTNLIGNAIKFTPEDGTIIISAEQIKHKGIEKLSFSVLDTGIGVKKNKLEKIFQAFEQVIESRKQAKSPGTGLGLAISKRLVEMMGGNLIVESKYKVGSTFTFTIPYIAPSEKEKQKLIATSAPASKNSPLEFKARILVVEDVITNQFVITNLLKNMGCSVDIANNGKEAVEAVEKNPYDMVLMDCQMPVMNGFDATKLIRSKGFTKLPIVALTANALDGDKEKCLDSGMDDFLSKPINKDHVISALKKYTNK